MRSRLTPATLTPGAPAGQRPPLGPALSTEAAAGHPYPVPAEDLRVESGHRLAGEGTAREAGSCGARLAVAWLSSLPGQPAALRDGPLDPRGRLGALHPAGVVAGVGAAPAPGRLPGCRRHAGDDRAGHRRGRGRRGVPDRRGRPRGEDLVLERAQRAASCGSLEHGVTPRSPARSTPRQHRVARDARAVAGAAGLRPAVARWSLHRLVSGLTGAPTGPAAPASGKPLSSRDVLCQAGTHVRDAGRAQDEHPRRRTRRSVTAPPTTDPGRSRPSGHPPGDLRRRLPRRPRRRDPAALRHRLRGHHVPPLRPCPGDPRRPAPLGARRRADPVVLRTQGPARPGLPAPRAVDPPYGQARGRRRSGATSRAAGRSSAPSPRATSRTSSSAPSGPATRSSTAASATCSTTGTGPRARAGSRPCASSATTTSAPTCCGTPSRATTSRSASTRRRGEQPAHPARPGARGARVPGPRPALHLAPAHARRTPATPTSSRPSG